MSEISSVPADTIVWAYRHVEWFNGRFKRTVRKDVAHLEVAGGEPDDGGLVQLAGDGRREWQHLGKIQELCVLLLSATARRVLALLFHTCQQTTVVRTTFTTQQHTTANDGKDGQQQDENRLRLSIHMNLALLRLIQGSPLYVPVCWRRKRRSIGLVNKKLYFSDLQLETI